MISGEKIEFKKWVQEQIKSNLIPTFQLKGFKKGRTNCYIRERNEIVQFVTFHLKQEKVRVWGGSSPVYFPLDGGAYKPFLCDSWLSSSGIAVPPREHTLTPDAEKKWEEAERLIKESILPQLDQINDLENLMTQDNFSVPDSGTWKGIKWYAEGVFECLSKDFDNGMERLRAAQGCKVEYLEFLKNIGMSFGERGDQMSVIYSYIDKFCNAVTCDNYTKEMFLEVYNEVCNDSRKWFKL